MILSAAAVPSPRLPLRPRLLLCVLALWLLTTAGQLLGALVLDLLITDVVDVHLLVGMTLAFLAVAVAPGPQYWRRSR